MTDAEICSSPHADDLPRPEPVAKNSGIKEPVEDKTPPMTVISSVERNAPTASANATATPSSCESPLGKGDSSVADRPISGIGLLPSGILASELPEKASSNPPSGEQLYDRSQSPSCTLPK